MGWGQRLRAAARTRDGYPPKSGFASSMEIVDDPNRTKIHVLLTELFQSSAAAGVR